MAVCRVCELNDGDTSEKLTCYCELCDAYICRKHRKDYFARTLAAVKDIFQ